MIKKFLFTIAFILTSTSLLAQFSVLELADDFINSGGDTRWDGYSLGGTSISAPSDPNHPGILRLSTGRQATGQVIMMKELQGKSLLLGGGQITLDYVIRIPILSTTDQPFIVRIGLGDTHKAFADQENGVYFEYNSFIDSNWRIITTNNGSRTSETTFNPVNNDWFRLTIVIDATASTASFIIDGAEVAPSPLITNIPAEPVSPFFQIIKNANGTDARFLDVDLFNITQDLGVPR